MALTITPAAIVSADTADTAGIINRFAMELYGLDSAQPRNIFFSPYCVVSSMAVIYDAARGRAAEEMKAALHFPGNPGELKDGLKAMREGLTGREKYFTLTSASALWASAVYRLNGNFTGSAKEQYAAEASSLDFSGDTAAAQASINSWFEKLLGRRAKAPVADGMIGARTRLVLASAASLKADWKFKFDPQKTRPEYFVTAPMSKSVVEMMHTKVNAVLDEESWPGARVLELPFTGTEISMYIFLPDGPDTSVIDRYMTMDNFNAWKASLAGQKPRPEAVDLSLPRFTLDSRQLLGGPLSGIGIPTAFTSADLSGMTQDSGLQISQALHQAFLDINEDGADDAYVKAEVFISFNPTMITIGKPAEFRVDHPFIFIIQDNRTGGIIFMGRVTDPSAA